MVARQALVIWMVLLLACPAWSIPNIVGTAAGSQSATVRGTVLIPGTTIFSGDTIEVGPKGNARIALAGGMQVHVTENSQVRLSKATDKIQLEVIRGGALFRTSEQAPLEALLADATVRSVNGQPAVGLVAMLNADSAVVRAEKGTLVVSTDHDGKTVILRQGEVAEVKLMPADQQGTDQSEQEKKKKRRRKALVIWLGGGAAAAATAAGIALTQGERVSPSRPK